MGKQTYLGIFGVVGLAAIAFRADSNGALMIAVGTIILVIAIAVLNYRYADRHPVEAMMEGTEMLALQHQMLAAKRLELPKESAVVPNPQGAPPNPNPPTETDEP